MVRRLNLSSEVSFDFLSQLEAYSEQLKSVYELELFYGDSTIKTLIKHTKSMVSFFKKFEGINDFTDSQLDKIFEDKNKNIEETQTENKQ